MSARRPVSTAIPLHWSAAEALAFVTFLESLREQIWLLYCEDVRAMMREASAARDDDRQLRLQLDPDEPF